MTTTLDATGTAAAPGSTITAYDWEFGDGAYGSGVKAVHTYTAAGRYNVTLTTTESSGARAATSRFISAADTTVDVLMDQFYQGGCPYKEYWLLRQNTYGDKLLRNQVPCANYDPWVYFSSTSELQMVNPSWVYSLYHFDARVRNHPGYNLSEPVVLPVFNRSAHTLPTSYVELNLTFDYLDSPTIQALQSTPFAVNKKYSDGFGYLVQGNITMDLETSKRIFGVAGNVTTQQDAQWWWHQNTGPQPRKPGPLETKYAQWLEDLGNVRPGHPNSGKYDIYNAFEWYYESDITWLNAAIGPDGTTKVRVFWDGWGLDTLMARWWYWGNASYRNAVCVRGDYPECPATLPYGAVLPRGWMPMETCWCEQAKINGRITSSLDLNFQAIQEYHLMAWANWGADGVPNTPDDQPAWVWAPALMDYVPRQNSGSPAAEGYPNSELRWYEGLTAIHGSPGSYAYGRHYEYMGAPTRWRFGAGSTLTLIMPTFNMTWYDPVLSRWNATAKAGDYVTFSSPMVLRQVCSASNDPGACSSAPQTDYYLWDARTNVLSMAGPHDWGTTALPLRAAPWIEFGPAHMPTAYTVGKPTYAKGDYWRYSLSGEITLDLGAALGGNATLHVSGDRTLRITEVRPGSVTELDLTTATATGTITYYDNLTGTQRTIALREVITVNLTRTLGGDEAGDTSYRGTIYINTTATSNGIPFTFGVKATVVSTLVADDWTFPLATGMRGQTATHAVVQVQLFSPFYQPPPSTQEANTTTRYIALRAMNVTVPAGQFDTLPVDSWTDTTPAGQEGLYTSLSSSVGGNHVRSYYSREANGFVKFAFFDGRGSEVLDELLAAYYLAPHLSSTAAVNHAAGLYPLAVHFTSTVSGGVSPYSYSWAFGDGHTSDQPNPDHTFTGPGSFNVTVTVVDASDQSSVAYVTVVVGVPPIELNLAANVEQGTGPLQVAFTTVVSGGVPPYSYAWDFGDGGTSTEPNPTHTFTRAGTYTVTLTVSDAMGGGQTATHMIVVRQNSPLYTSPLLLVPLAALVAVVASGVALARRRQRRARSPPPPP